MVHVGAFFVEVEGEIGSGGRNSRRPVGDGLQVSGYRIIRLLIVSYGWWNFFY